MRWRIDARDTGPTARPNKKAPPFLRRICTAVEFADEVRTMAQPIKFERSHASKEELDVLARTHFPALLDLENDELSAAQSRLRAMRAKEKTMVRDMRRHIRGKGQQRGSSFPGNVEKPSRRKQIFASALKRINSEIARRQAIEAREAFKASAQRAFALKSSATSRDILGTGRTSNTGMTPLESRRRRTRVHPAKVGSVSQATKAAQAAKDARPT